MLVTSSQGLEKGTGGKVVGEDGKERSRKRRSSILSVSPQDASGLK